MSKTHIKIRNAHQNNLKHLDLEIPLGEMTVITGVSGSGKSSLAFDTIYAEGQRRYVETFSPYARQFLDRMDRPQVDSIEGIPPAIAIDQVNPVRTSRSTVGTMTELNDHLKLLFARAATPYCRSCGREVRRETPQEIVDQLLTQHADKRAQITFSVPIPENFTADEILQILEQQGYLRSRKLNIREIEVTQDRLRLSLQRRDRLAEAVEHAMSHGQGEMAVQLLDESRQPLETLRFSADLHCTYCDIHYPAPQPNHFSFNSPLGACDSCRGFGRVMGVDYDLVIPDHRKSLADGAIRPFQSGRSMECQEDLMLMAGRNGIPTDTPWGALPEKIRRWVIDGEGKWDDGKWYGVKGYFDFLETKSYKMHIRVLLSKYRAYTPCPRCHGARLKSSALDYRIGSRNDADTVCPPGRRFRPDEVSMPEQVWRTLPGLNIHDLMHLPLSDLQRFVERRVADQTSQHEALAMLLEEIRTRLDYLNTVGLGYLTLDRQSRTLSGGEVQRINLTTALGTSLVNTLFVLDEPSIGLHPRDINRINQVLHRLRDAGNSLLVVEHDPQIMLAADRVIDIGPGPGENGGEITFFGTPAQLRRSRISLTADYLSGHRQVALDKPIDPPDAECDYLRLLGASEHNLKGIDVAIPLNRLVCITGVSGSGKSTLINDILYPALCKLKGKPKEAPGAHREILGADLIDQVILLDQSAIGKSSRSNPASYVKALDPIRKLLSRTPLAKERGYTAGTFSFNSGNGRCPTCSGSGFEHVEMQFLSDVYLRCPDCNGKRYKREVLDVQFAEHSISDILELTVSEAITLFRSHLEVRQALEPLEAVGLDYLRLGQPVPTLSGGEAQRLKLAGYLSRAKRLKNTNTGSLFLLDEPTTGLHFADIAILLKALERLLNRSHSLVVIEHNLDVIRAADWIIDLGPEGGDAGGEIVCEGTPERLCADTRSYTGAALKTYLQTTSLDRPIKRQKRPPASDHIMVRNAREHNLKGVDISIPHNRFTVITGVSGSGKSTLAFDILFVEGQRRYLESLNAYARQFVQPAARPEIDAIHGIPPTVAIEQRTSRGGRKSTVGTLTEIHHFLRLLFVKLGVQYCPECEIPIQPQSREEIHERLARDYQGQHIQLLAPLVVNRKGLYNELAKWADRKGYAFLHADGVPLPTDAWPHLDRYIEHNIDLPVGELTPGKSDHSRLAILLNLALDHGKGVVRVLTLDSDGKPTAEQSFSTHRTCPGCGKGFDEPDPRLFSYNSKHGWCPDCYGTGVTLRGFDAEQSGEEEIWLENADIPAETCPCCAGARLRPEALAIYYHDWSIADYATCPVDEAIEIFRTLRPSKRELEIAGDVFAEIQARLNFLQEVGLGYLTLDRAAPTLSGGEAQRIRLAAQLGSNLQGVCYILDEPTIGLHPRDNRLLLDTLQQLCLKGNSVVVVEHDEETIRRAEHVIDIGPGAGSRGGELVYSGPLRGLLKNRDSLTGQFLVKPLQHPMIKPRPTKASRYLEIKGATQHNLKCVDVAIPLQRLVVVTGVSGSGKSTLIREVLVKNLQPLLLHDQKKRKTRQSLHGCQALTGWEVIERVLEVDQTPIGKTPRSCPATYIGFWDAIRKLFAATPDARIHGWGVARFSFNTKQGRCESCEGKGYQRVEMSFLPNVTTHCESCHGKRFNRETLSVTYKDKSIGDILEMSIDEAVAFFSAHPAIHHPLQLLQDVGLGYLTLGQQSPTLSGGEAQRIKLVTELAKAKPSLRRRPTPTLYVLDEPTVGLHMADVERIIQVLHRLVEAGHSVIVIEHNLDIVAEADWVIDLGPEGGDQGGEVVIKGRPARIARANRRSHTGKALQEFLAAHLLPR